MTILKELTWHKHKEAERQKFVKLIFTGKITSDQYAIYLINQHAIYDILEAFAMSHGLFNDMPSIRRAPAIFEDFIELWGDTPLPKLCNTVSDYHKHLFTIQSNPIKIMAHVYVRHMGDLAGGQILAKKVPGSGKYYQFENVDLLKKTIEDKLTIDMADEANICFDFASQLFKELSESIDE
jgi:heme oxygenase (biliverdin-producing, ferredoxin)